MELYDAIRSRLWKQALPTGRPVFGPPCGRPGFPERMTPPNWSSPPGGARRRPFPSRTFLSATVRVWVNLQGRGFGGGIAGGDDGARVCVAQGVRGWRRTEGAGPGQNNLPVPAPAPPRASGVPPISRTPSSLCPVQDRPKPGKNRLLTLRLAVDRVAQWVVSPETISPSRTQRSVSTGAREAISHQCFRQIEPDKR